ncbi:response regulator [Spirosoma luteum]|uniref:response regulator n=1 Tax=Spirosoma luteum TaxID=431553 RepID=UPI00035EB71E|nr:response regulator [Spirosoma luteum]
MNEPKRLAETASYQTWQHRSALLFYDERRMALTDINALDGRPTGKEGANEHPQLHMATFPEARQEIHREQGMPNNTVVNGRRFEKQGKRLVTGSQRLTDFFKRRQSTFFGQAKTVLPKRNLYYYRFITARIGMQPINNTKTTNHTVKQITVLVIEDNDDIWTIISILLKRQLPAVSFHRVVNARQALDYLDEALMQPQAFPQLILQNLYLPLLTDGLDLLQEIRTRLAAQSAPQLPILVMSSSNNPDDIRRAYQAGASSFYHKPTDMSHWNTYFERLRLFWLESVTLPDVLVPDGLADPRQ